MTLFAAGSCKTSDRKSFFRSGCLCFLICSFLSAESAFIEDTVTLTREKPAKIIGKFCYDFDPERSSTIGLLAAQIKTRKGSEQELNSLFYVHLDDQKESFPYTQEEWNPASCSLADLKPTSRWIEELTDTKKLEDTGWAKETEMHQHVRPRWWYVAVCADFKNGNNEVVLDYRLHMVHQDGRWQAEVSFDKQNLIYYHFFFMVCNLLVVLLVQAYSDGRRRNPYLNLTLLSGFSAFLSNFFSFLFFWVMTSGAEAPLAHLFSRLSFWVSRLTMYTALQLLSQGWMFTHYCKLPFGLQKRLVDDKTNASFRDRLPKKKYPLPPLIFLFLAFGIGLYVERRYDDMLRQTHSGNRQVRFFYNTTPGLLVCSLDLLLMCDFFLGVQILIKNGNGTRLIKDKIRESAGKFYNVYGKKLTIYFMVLPFVAFLGSQIDAWVRHFWLVVVWQSAHVSICLFFAAALCNNLPIFSGSALQQEKFFELGDLQDTHRKKKFLNYMNEDFMEDEDDGLMADPMVAAVSTSSGPEASSSSGGNNYKKSQGRSYVDEFDEI